MIWNFRSKTGLSEKSNGNDEYLISVAGHPTIFIIRKINTAIRRSIRKFPIMRQKLQTIELFC